MYLLLLLRIYIDIQHQRTINASLLSTGAGNCIALPEDHSRCFRQYHRKGMLIGCCKTWTRLCAKRILLWSPQTWQLWGHAVPGDVVPIPWLQRSKCSQHCLCSHGFRYDGRWKMEEQLMALGSRRPEFAISASLKSSTWTIVCTSFRCSFFDVHFVRELPRRRWAAFSVQFAVAISRISWPSYGPGGADRITKFSSDKK